MRVRLIGGILLLGVIAYAVVSAVRTRPFSPAVDLPRGAVVYLQIEDLPGLIKLWNRSSFKEKYLQSQNFDELSKRHLGLKIASRWQEFSDAVGAPIDLDFVSSLADKRAAVAVYDIGKLDLVFIAPMSATTFEATRLMQGSDKFDSEQLDDGTQIYRVNVDADKGRQKQQILFTHIKGRLIVATSEKLLAQAVSIITGRLKKNALSDDPAFSSLADKMTPKTATVWVDQAALTSDYYFKRYWLMSDVGSLKNIRSGMFELTVGETGIVEDREFLMKVPINASAVSLGDARQLMSRVPDDAQYYSISRASTEAVRGALNSVLSLSSPKNDAGEPDTSRSFTYVNYDDDDYGSDKFDQYIDETDDDAVTMKKADASTDLSEVVAPGGPQAVLTLARSRTEQAPRFVQFDKAAVITLSAPRALDRSTFERTLAAALAARLLVHGQKLDGQWVTKTDRGVTWREVQAPVLGWGIQYAVDGNELIITNDPEFLSKVLTINQKVGALSPTQYSEFTVLRPDKIRDDFRSTFDRLAVKDDFFTGNILSLVDSAPAIERVEVKRSSQGNLMHEQLTITLGQAHPAKENATE